MRIFSALAMAPPLPVEVQAALLEREGVRGNNAELSCVRVASIPLGTPVELEIISKWRASKGFVEIVRLARGKRVVMKYPTFYRMIELNSLPIFHRLDPAADEIAILVQTSPADAVPALVRRTE